MLSNTESALFTPIIGRVIDLNKYIFSVKSIPQKSILNTYVQPLLTKCYILFILALNLLRGKDYAKRATETLEEIESVTYLIYALKGWSNKVVSVISAKCEEIQKQLYCIKNARIVKSTDESK